MTAGLAIVAVVCSAEGRRHGEVTTLTVVARKIVEDTDAVVVPS